MLEKKNNIHTVLEDNGTRSLGSPNRPGKSISGSSTSQVNKYKYQTLG